MNDLTLRELRQLLTQAHTNFQFYECLMLIGFEDAYEGYAAAVEAKAVIKSAIADAECDGV